MRSELWTEAPQTQFIKAWQQAWLIITILSMQPIFIPATLRRSTKILFFKRRGSHSLIQTFPQATGRLEFVTLTATWWLLMRNRTLTKRTTCLVPAAVSWTCLTRTASYFGGWSLAEISMRRGDWSLPMGSSGSGTLATAASMFMIRATAGFFGETKKIFKIPLH